MIINDDHCPFEVHMILFTWVKREPKLGYRLNHHLLKALAIAVGDLSLLPTQSPTCFSFTSPRGTSFRETVNINMQMYFRCEIWGNVADTGHWGRDYQVKSCHKKFTPSSHSRWQDRKARAQPCCTQQATFQGSPPCLQTVLRWQRIEPQDFGPHSLGKFQNLALDTFEQEAAKSSETFRQN